MICIECRAGYHEICIDNYKLYRGCDCQHREPNPLPPGPKGGD